MSVHVSAELRRRVRERDFNCCAYCRTAENLMAATFEIEHIVPRSSGGKTTIANLTLACPTCNRCKADQMHAIDPESHVEVDLYRPSLQLWNEHFAWNHDATEIVGLTTTGRATVSALRMNRPALVRLRRMWALLGEHPPELED